MADVYAACYLVRPTGYLQGPTRARPNESLEVTLADPWKDLWIVRNLAAPKDQGYNDQGALVPLFGPRGGRTKKTTFRLDEAILLAQRLVDLDLPSPDYVVIRPRR